MNINAGVPQRFRSEGDPRNDIVGRPDARRRVSEPAVFHLAREQFPTEDTDAVPDQRC